jgi:hypothetical protein
MLEGFWPGRLICVLYRACGQPNLAWRADAETLNAVPTPNPHENFGVDIRVLT